jgi:ribonuclease Z
MSIEYHVLGAAGCDNALLLYLHTGEALDRLLFDCGDGCLAGLPFAEIQRIDALFFSHLHMDHIGGFDSFFRCTYNRTRKPNRIWGPAETARILHHRFRGFLWNLYANKQATWRVCEVTPEQITCTRFELAEAFATAYPEGEETSDGVLWRTPDYTVTAVQMDHLTPSLTYIVREGPRLNVDTTRLAELGLRPGPWLKAVKTPPPGATQLEIDGVPHPLAALRAALLTETSGDAVAYLTDFRLDDAAIARLLPHLAHCKVLICESTYRHADLALATQNYHLTATQAAELARRAEVGTLVLIHLSDRYPPAAWPELLCEARAIFPNTVFPKHWGIG